MDEFVGEESTPVRVPQAEIEHRKRKRDERIDGYESGDEDAILKVIDRDVGGELDNFNKCLRKQSREVGLNGAKHVAANLFNDRIFKSDENASLQDPTRERLLEKPITPSAVLKYAKNLEHLPQGAEWGLSEEMKFVWWSIQHLQGKGGLWQEGDNEEAVVNEKASKHWKMFMDTYIKLYELRDRAMAKNRNIKYSAAKEKSGEIPKHLFRSL